MQTICHLASLCSWEIPKRVLFALPFMFPVFVNAATPFARTLDAWTWADFGHKEISPAEYLNYSQEEISRLVPQIVKWIPIQDALLKHEDQSWRQFVKDDDWARFRNAMPGDHPLAMRLSMRLKAASTLSSLASSKQRCIVDTSVIPSLIDGLENPMPSDDRRDCFRALSELTRLYREADSFWHRDAPPRDRKLIADWFRDWYRANSTKQLIITPALEERVKKRFLSLVSTIKTISLNPDHSLFGFREVNEGRMGRDPLFSEGFDGESPMWDRMGISIPHGRGWLSIRVRVQTPRVKGVKVLDEDGIDVRTAVIMDAKGATPVYHENIDGTDLAIEVHAARLKENEMKELKAALVRVKDDEGGAGQKSPAADPPGPASNPAGVAEAQPQSKEESPPARPVVELRQQQPRKVTGGKPFENSLGMKFVSLPIPGGPTKGRRVLVSVWETRVRDYERFATETKRAWAKPPFEQGPMHPAVNVSWEDARAFCAWLSKKEGRTYRLPTDVEWSRAAEMPAEKGRTLLERCYYEPGGVFPWGTQWPPPGSAGNYGQELKTDDFKYTSPVGSFNANSHGIYDLRGNAWEWCGDEGLTSRPYVFSFRVLRGGSWLSEHLPFLRSSFRYRTGADYRRVNTGFRCVLSL